MDNLCPGRVAQISGYRGVGLASPLYQVCDVDLLKRVLAQAEAWDEVAETGFKKVAGVLSNDRQLAELLARYADNPDDVLRRTFAIVGDSGAAWTGNAIDGLFAVADKPDLGITVAESITQYGDEAVKKTFEILGGSSVNWNEETFKNLARVLDRYEGIDDFVIQRIDNLKNVEGIDRLMKDLALDPTLPKQRGALFHLELADEIGEDRIQSLSELVEWNGQMVEGPDIIAYALPKDDGINLIVRFQKP